MKKHDEILANLIKKLIKFNLEKNFQSHNQFASLAFRKATNENKADMSVCKEKFRAYVEFEDKSYRQESAKYRWKVDRFKKDHPGLFGQEEQRLSDLEQMIAALEDELFAAQDDVQRNSYKILRIDGIRLGTNNQAYACFLKLSDDDEPNFKDGSPCVVRVKEAELGQAKVIDYDSKEQCVYLSSNSDLSKLTGPALRLFVDMTWLLEALIEKLRNKTIDSLKSGPLGGFIQGEIQQVEVNYPIEFWPGSLNKSQLTAYQSSLKKNVTLIWGPPGTGKSYTLAHVILSLSRIKGKTVVTCISNAALDSLIIGFLKTYNSFKEKNPFAIVDSNFVRLGISRTPEVLESEILYPADDQLDEWRHRLTEIRSRLAKEVDSNEKVRLKKEVNELYEQIKKHNQERINNAKVIFTTAAQFTVLTIDGKDETTDLNEQAGINLKGLQFDNIVLDEVSMMYPPQFIGLCQDINSRIIAAGDFRQLGPIHLSSTALALRWLDKDIFTYGKVFNHLGEVVNRPYLFQLLDQLRSHSKICDLINRTFYEGKLVSKGTPPEVDYLSLKPYSDKPVVYINLEGRSENKVNRSSKGSRYNNFSANIVSELAGWAASESKEILVGVITPYRAQVGKIKNLLKVAYDTEVIERIKVGSIHSFQGDEADVIIYDIVDAPNQPIGLLYRHVTGERLINVAVSRAKRKLIVVGNIQNMHDGKGHTLLSRRLIQVTKDISRYNFPLEIK